MPSPRPGDLSDVRGERMSAVERTAEETRGVTGVVGDGSARAGDQRSGEDVRRRGWFWHWNSIVTQFAPIIGLKGVGLLNSYTVWTDRREESAYRGFAFPSQQSEADFYGEDRNELITINKILVELDLIEIRKEMVLRTDERGRKWRVPHNLYRVKDHGDDVNLTTRDVLRIANLADRDRAVYRYVRKMFSPKFAPIDRQNVWHGILTEVRATDVWQRLETRAAKDEGKTSARTKAGHASRKTAPYGGISATTDSSDSTDAVSTVPETPNDSSTGATVEDRPTAPTIAASANKGSGLDVDQANNGLTPERRGDVAPANRGEGTVVDPGSTTYYQSLTTTTTTDSGHIDREDGRSRPPASPASGFDSGSAPDDARDRDATVRLYEEANGKPSTPAARRHLKGLAADHHELAGAAGVSGWKLVGCAVDEAVASGSSYVAPKRVREILARWSREGVPTEYVAAEHGDSTAPLPTKAVTDGSDRSHNPGRAPSGPAGPRRDARPSPGFAPPVDQPVPIFAIPECGMNSQQVWSGACHDITAAGSIPEVEARAWLRETRLIGRDADGTYVVGLPNAFYERRAIKYQDALEAALAVMTGGDARISIVQTRRWLADHAEATG